ncbi:murein L,D-transpeptidase catalytic domain family protein [Adhaeribacter aquaticus]|uniref:murein L,D-transpeptidase catalytic domain family protein n=1 Tax=Adhaeribacter aquaticus TaxID=299567 RepID=UPI00146FB3AE|nr:murein L,D-transpeptidase catalytic domain family protein [Adhaeribacter aquaticus]
MKKTILTGASFLMFAFAMPAMSWNPNVSSQEVPNFEAALPLTAEAEVELESTVVKESAEDSYEKYVNEIYDAADLRRAGLKKDIFKRAIVGYHNLKLAGQVSPYKSVLSIVDFNKSGKNKRFWTIDLKAKKLVFNSLVAHGQGSGGDKPFAFSNKPNSHQSSLGFYVTDKTYYGVHGLALRLDGVDKGFNTNARNRAIVVHGADYVSKDFIKANGYLGRSFGCPVLPSDLTPKVINVIKEKTVLYIEGPESKYTSVYLNRDKAIAHYASQTESLQASL